MLKVRIRTALLLGGFLLAAMFLAAPRIAVLVYAAMCIAGAWEWAAFGGWRSAPARALYTAAIALLMAVLWRAGSDSRALYLVLVCACLWWGAALLWLRFAPQWHRPAVTLACGAVVLVPAFGALARLQLGARDGVRGPELVLWLLLLVSAADIGAYFAGRRYGRHKLAPRISPGKTWEGVIGGLLAVSLVAALGAYRLSLPVPAGVLFGCIVGVFSIVGDLTESMFKRAAGLKDSGVILPGHGGILDRVDSVVAAAPVYALGLLGSGAMQ